MGSSYSMRIKHHLVLSFLISAFFCIARSLVYDTSSNSIQPSYETPKRQLFRLPLWFGAKNLTNSQFTPTVTATQSTTTTTPTTILKKRDGIYGWKIFNPFFKTSSTDTTTEDTHLEWTYKSLESYGLNLPDSQAILHYPVAFGDWTGSKRGGLFILEELTSNPLTYSISLYSWQPLNHHFNLAAQYILPPHVGSVENVIPADMNQDGLLDLVVIYHKKTSRTSLSPNFSVLVVTQDPTSSASLNLIWDTASVSPSILTVVHPVLIDINFDGYPDLVGLFDVKESPLPKKLTSSGGRFVWINQLGKTFSNPIFFGDIYLNQYIQWDNHTLPPLSNPHSSAFVDVNGDCTSDVVFHVTLEDGTKAIEVWLATTNTIETQSNINVSFDSNEHLFDDSKENIMKDNNASTTSNVTSHDYLQHGVTSNNQDKQQPIYRYSTAHFVKLPKGSHQISFIDVNSDGAIDIIFPVCDTWNSQSQICSEGEGNHIAIIINEQIPLCKKSIFGTYHSNLDTCRLSSNLCTGSSFTWKPPRMYSFQSLIKASSLWNDLQNDVSFKASDRFPLTLRVGDFNLDGLPDLGVVIQLTNGTTGIALLRNRLHRSDTLLEIDKKSSNDEQESPLPFGLSKIILYPNATLDGMAFFDFEEDSHLDVLLWGYQKSSWWSLQRSETPSLAILKQSSELDQLYIKVTGLNGACNRYCSNGNNSWVSYGGNVYGGTLKMAGIDLDGNQFTQTLAMLPQSSYSPFQLPFALIGLAHVNNYVDYVYFGAPYVSEQMIKKTKHHRQLLPYSNLFPFIRDLLTEDHFLSPTEIPLKNNLSNILSAHRWISLIPNSFVIAKTYPRWDPSKWQLELSISPSRMFWKILISVILFLIAIASVILILDLKEKAEDLKEHQGFRRHYIAAV